MIRYSFLRASVSSSQGREIIKSMLNIGSGKRKKMTNSHLGLFLPALLLLCSLSAHSTVVLATAGGGYDRGGLPLPLPVTSFDEGYTQIFGEDNLVVHRDGRTVHLTLDERTGSGFASQDIYLHGFFSASIKLPSDYTAGVVVAFYMSNGDIYEKNHDEIDFEFLGNIRGKEWRIQTNVYGNGSTNVGREERYGFWFDPANDFHQYSILWTETQIIFYVAGVPIREVKKTEAMGGQFPAKPMTIYVTIWDGSDWATNGGKYRVNYKYAPYIAEFSDLVLHGCAVNPVDHLANCDNAPAPESIPTGISRRERAKMESLRKNYMMYSYCYDRIRYKAPPSECVINPEEAEHLRTFDPVTFGGGRHRRPKRHHWSGNANSM